MTAGGQLHIAKLRLTSFLAWLLVNSQILIKVLLNFLLSILLDQERERNKGALSKKAFFKVAFLILLLFNSSENIFLLFLLYPVIILSNLCFSITKSGVGNFSKNNSGTVANNPDIAVDDQSTATNNPSIGADNLGMVANYLGTRMNANIKANNPGITTDNLGITVDHLGIRTNTDVEADNSSIGTNNLSIKTDANAGVDNLGIAADNPNTKTDIDARADNPSIATSHQVCICIAFLFVLHHAFFLLASFSKSVTASLLSSLLFLSLTLL